MTQLSISTGIGLSIFYTFFLGGIFALFLFLPKGEATNKYFHFVMIAVPLLLFGIYYFLLFWTTFKIDNQKLIIEQKRILRNEIKEFENIEKIFFYRRKGNYILQIESKNEEEPTQYFGFSKSNKKEIQSFLEKNDFEVEYR
ncbi:EbsA family protein [Bernardetia sp. ABR2-2B]|uniref:EbsA family protein n=1 Tax=Bernardetia sp. ABR2-2B TaxID=3127472 RepID=UPI0030CBE19D